MVERDHSVGDPPQAERATWRGVVQAIAVGVVLLLLLGGRIFARLLPPEGALRRWVGPGVALVLLCLGTVKVSVEGWRVWRGAGEDPYRRSILPQETTDRLVLALPSVAVVAWAALIGAVNAALFFRDGSTDLRFIDGAAEIIVSVGWLVLGAVVCLFVLFAYTASRWRWPTFVLPATERRKRRMQGKGDSESSLR